MAYPLVGIPTAHMEVTIYDLRPLGRASDEDKDYLWIRKRTGAWGSSDSTPIAQRWEDALRGDEGCLDLREVDVQSITSLNRIDREGELRYVANNGTWECVNEYQANRWLGVLLMPDRDDPEGKICCAQFISRERKKTRVWLTIEQAKSVLQTMEEGRSISYAVRQVNR